MYDDSLPLDANKSAIPQHVQESSYIVPDVANSRTYGNSEHLDAKTPLTDFNVDPACIGHPTNGIPQLITSSEYGMEYDDSESLSLGSCRQSIGEMQGANLSQNDDIIKQSQSCRELQLQGEHPILQYQDDTQEMRSFSLSEFDIPSTVNEGNYSGESGQENRSSHDGYIIGPGELIAVKL